MAYEYGLDFEREVASAPEIANDMASASICDFGFELDSAFAYASELVYALDVEIALGVDLDIESVNDVDSCVRNEDGAKSPPYNTH